MNNGQYGKSILNKRKGVAAAVAIMAITAASLFFLVNTAEAYTDPLPIVGTVYDTQGNPVVGATVIVRDQETGAWGMNVTDGSGYYEITLGGLDRPWTVWFDNDRLLGTASYDGQTGVNETYIDWNYYNTTGYEWLNITLGTPETTKTIGTPQFTKYDYDAGQNRSYLVSPQVTLPSVGTPVLSFYTWFQVESNEPSTYDQMNIYVAPHGYSGIGINLTDIDPLNPTTDPPAGDNLSFYGSGDPAGVNVGPEWVYKSYDLTDWAGENVTIVFEFDPVDELYNYWEGWLIDNIRIGSTGTFYDTVEAGSGNWTYTGLWHITDHRSYAGDHAWYCGMEHSYVSPDTPFTMDATGDFEEIFYRYWWNGTWTDWTNYTGAFTLPEECTHYLEFYADNDSYNDEPIRNQTHYVDNSPPTSTMELGSPNSTIEYDGEFYEAIKSCTPMWINATDLPDNECASGVEWLNYSVWWNENEPGDYQQLETVSIHDNDENDMDKRVGFITAELHFDEECFHEIKWNTVDYLGHADVQKSIDIAVDMTAPDINKTIGEPQYIGLGYYGATNWTWVNCSTNFTFHITDDGCGGGVGVWKFGINVYWNETRVPQGDVQDFTLIDVIEVVDGEDGDLDGEVNGEISYRFTFDRDCFHEPELWAIDYVGNYYTFKEKDMVDCTPPAIEKRVDKVVALEQTEMNNASDIYTGAWQSFLAPWSYIDAVKLHLCGYFDEGVNVSLLTPGQKDPLAKAYLGVDDIPVNETGYFCGWLQFHFPSRIYTEHGKMYLLYVRSESGTSGVNWSASDSNPYPDGNATVDGRWNDTWDYAFKIEYYPVVLDDTNPTLLDYMFAEYNETGDYDHLHGSWVTSEAFFNLSSWDEGCMDGVGLDTLEYRIWWNGTWTEWMNYTEPFNLTEECTHYVEIRATDILGNVRIVNQTHYVDNSPPELRVEYPDAHGFYYDEQEDKQYVRAGKTFYLNLTDMPDNECAVGWHNFTFYWRYEYTNFTTPSIEVHPADGSDNEYPGELVNIDGNWWWKVDVTGDPSIALSFDRECMHTIYYFYNATDWLDNEVNSGIQEEVIYVDENGPEMEKEHPPCYTDEPVIYLHPNNWADFQWENAPWGIPGLNGWIANLNWTQLYPTDDLGREYEGTDNPKFDGYVEADDGDYIELVDKQYGVHRLYEIKNLTVTLEIYNETLDEVKYVDFVSYWDGYWPAGSNFGEIQSNPLGTLWKEIHADFGTVYNLTSYEAIKGFGVGSIITLNNTETDEWHNWTIENATWDLILDPVPFIQKCSRINLTAWDTPQTLKLVDQFQNVGEEEDLLQLPSNINAFPWDAQEFVVTENITHINETWLYLHWVGTANVTIYLYDEDALADDGEFTIGEELAMTYRVLSGSDEGWVEFYFEPGVAVDSSKKLYIDVFRQPDSATVYWFNTPYDSYPDGEAYGSGELNETSPIDWKFAIVAYRPNPCASGVEDIYYGYEYNGTFHPVNETDNESIYGTIVNITQYYSWEYINQSEQFQGRTLWYTYDPSIGVHFHEECIHWLYYWAKDNVCHHTNVTMQVYHVDEYDPVVDKHLSGHGWYAPVNITVDECHEAGYNSTYSGWFNVSNKWFSEDCGGWIPNPSGQYVDKYAGVNFTIENGDLNHNLLLTIRIEEILGDGGITFVNNSDTNTFTETWEIEAGATETFTVDIYDNWQFLREGKWYWWVEDISNVTQYLKTGKQIWLDAYDPGYCPSGIQDIYWRYEWNDTMYPEDMYSGVVDGSTLSDEPDIANYYWYIYNETTTGISFNEECRHDLYYFAKDRSCHNSTVHHEVYFVDGSEPTINQTLPEHGSIGETTTSLDEEFYIPVNEGWAIVNGSTSYWDLKSDEPSWDNHDMYTAKYGDYNAMAWKSGGSADAWLITPQVTVPEDGNLSFWYSTYYSSGIYDASFEVAVNNVSTQTNTAAFNTVWDSGTFYDNTYRKVEIDLHQYAGQQVYIGFHATEISNAYPNGGILLDEVWLGPIEHVAWEINDNVEGGIGDWTTEDLTLTQDTYWDGVERVPVYNDSDPAPGINCFDPVSSYNTFALYNCNWNDTFKMATPLDLSDLNESDGLWFNFTLWLDVSNSGDMLCVDAWNGTGNWTQLASWNADQTWEWESIDISQYIGNETVWFRFRFVSDDTYGQANGAFIHTVNISNATGLFSWTDDFGSVGYPDTSNWVGQMLETSRWHIVNTTDVTHPDPSAHSLNHSWWNGDDDTEQYLNCMDDALVSPEIDLSGYDSSYDLVLMFWLWYDTYNSNDRLYVEVTDDGGANWDSITYFYGSRGWVKHYIDLSTYIGDTIQIRFRFASDENYVDYGVYLDDIQLEVRNITTPTFEEDFEKTFPPAGWSEDGKYDSSTSRYGWQRYQTPDFSYAGVHGWYNSNQDEWLITPEIENLPKFSNLTFEHVFDKQESEVHAYVMIKVDGGSWQQLQEMTASGGSTEVLDISLWGYHGHDVQLAFRFVSPTDSTYSYAYYYYDDYNYWGIEWVKVTSIGFLRAGAPIHLEVTDQPAETDCDAGVESIFWRYEENERTHPGDVDDDGYAIISGDRLFELYGEDYNISDIRDYDWYVVNDTTSLNITFGEECIHDLWYFAKDNVCHRTDIVHERYYVDGMPPDTYFNVSWGNHPWIPGNPTDFNGYENGMELPWNYWYGPDEDDYYPTVICINDDFHFWAEHWGDEPCIYPYDQQNRTYYRWQVWNETTEEWEDAWPTEQNYTDGMEGVVWGDDIVVSEHSDEIEGHYWMNGQGPDYFDHGCKHRLVYFSKDDLCNTEMPNYWEVGVDDQAPGTTVEFDNSTSGSWIHYGDDDTIYFQNCTWFIINATDYPNNTDCQTGIWKIDYTVWKWKTRQMDVDLLDNSISTDTIYIDGVKAGTITNYIDQDNNSIWSIGDYMHIEWSDAYENIYEDGWYRLREIDFDGGIYEVTVREVFGSAGEWDVLLPWQTVYETDIYGETPGPYEGITYDRIDVDGREYILVKIHLGDLLRNLTNATFNCGKYEIHWRVWDYNNMSTAEIKQDVAIDCTPPQTTKEFSEPVVEQTIAGGEVIHWVGPHTKIWLNGTDPFIWDSGVNETWYRFWSYENDTLLWKLGSGIYNKHYFTMEEAVQLMGYDNISDYFENNPLVYQPGIIELYHWSVDNVNHTEDWAESKQHIYVDDLPPISRVDNITPYLQQNVPFNITVIEIEDFGYEAAGPSGVCKVEVYYNHSQDNETWDGWVLYDTWYVPWSQRLDVPDWTLSFDAPEGAGWYRFKSIAYDCVANEEQPPFYHGTYDAECMVVADTEPPEVTKEYGHPNIEGNIGGETGHFITDNTPIYINATDMPEEDWWGIDKIYWSFDRGEWHESDSFNGDHTAGVVITPGMYDLQDGLHTIFYYATDMLGHVSPEGKQKFMLDNEAPDATVDTIVPYEQDMPVNITVQAADNIEEVGVANVTLYYRFSEDNETWGDWMPYGTDDTAPYEWSFIIDLDPGYYMPGYYQFVAVATDNLGNTGDLPDAGTEPDAMCYVEPWAEDFNADGHVNIFDMALLGQHYGETGEDLPWDLNGDGEVGLGDLILLGKKWTG